MVQGGDLTITTDQRRCEGSIAVGGYTADLATRTLRDKASRLPDCPFFAVCGTATE